MELVVSAEGEATVVGATVDVGQKPFCELGS